MLTQWTQESKTKLMRRYRSPVSSAYVLIGFGVVQLLRDSLDWHYVSRCRRQSVSQHTQSSGEPHVFLRSRCEEDV
ncbi:hypothetical protein BD309DRAFT_966072 [Dichomitus squalens]|nr:hypothetical protein BD309DRAFT_966072 [Dichomitus squalens]